MAAGRALPQPPLSFILQAGPAEGPKTTPWAPAAGTRTHTETHRDTDTAFIELGYRTVPPQLLTGAAPSLAGPRLPGAARGGRAGGCRQRRARGPGRAGPPCPGTARRRTTCRVRPGAPGGPPLPLSPSPFPFSLPPGPLLPSPGQRSQPDTRRCRAPQASSCGEQQGLFMPCPEMEGRWAAGGTQRWAARPQLPGALGWHFVVGMGRAVGVRPAVRSGWGSAAPAHLPVVQNHQVYSASVPNYTEQVPG